MASPAPSRQVVRFAGFEADPRAGQLWRDGLKVKLPEQSFRILCLLLRSPGEVVSREELRRELWPEDTFVDFEAGVNSAVRRLRRALGDSAGKPRFIETLPQHGYRFIAAVERTQPEAHRVIESLAVLPLENLSGDAAQDFFVDGMTDALITRLAQIRALRVVSRTSAMRYKGARKPLPEIGRDLKVDAVVEGTVIRSGGRVRITSQLVHAASDRHLWASQYERDATDILLLQAEVAQAIADEIRVKLTPQEQARLASGRLVKPKAYEAYLRGRFHWDKRTEQGMRKGLELFQQAQAEDPSFALSHAGVAESYNMLAFWGVEPPHEVAPRAREAATKALEMDASLAEAHAALGWTSFAYGWDWAAGERALLRAIELNPSYATAHQWYSHLLAYQGRTAEALAQVERTLELDPLSLVMNSSSALIFVLTRKYDQALQRVQDTLDLDPHFAPPYLWRGWALGQMGRHAEALEALAEGLRLSGQSPHYVAAFGHACAMAGSRAEALSVLGRLQEMSAQRYVSAYDFAVVHAGLGQREEAFGWLSRASEERSAWLVMIRADGRFGALRSDPRFAALLRGLNLAA